MDLNYFPSFLLNDKTLRANIETIIAESETLQDALNEVSKQLFVETATWGLEYWERDYGIVTDISKPINERRINLLAKIRGTGTVTKGLIDEVANAYAKTQVEVREDYATFNINMKFVGNYGIPPNIEDFKAQMRNIIPAHLTLSYEYIYFTFGQLKSYNFGRLSRSKFSDIRLGIIAT